MTSYVCIPQSKNNDPNYRYKMPEMRLSQESRLNGVKTNIKNLPEVAIALRVPESAILKYFCAEVGANSEGTTVIKGQHLLSDLARHLDKFIMKYVCCKKCKLPEITHEAKKKVLVGICRSCGNTDSSMDTMHKAGKQLHKDITTYYQDHPEMANTVSIGGAATAAAAAPDQGIGKAKKGKRKRAGAAADEPVEETKETDAERVAAIIAKGGEVNTLDSIALELNDPTILTAIDELKTFVDEQVTEGKVDCSRILSEVRQLQLQLNVTPEYKLYIAMVAIFGPHRNIVKQWETYALVFTTLLEQDADGGEKHLLQTIIQFFGNKYPDQQKFAVACCTNLYNASMITDELFISWHGKKAKLDRHSKLHDLSAGKVVRPLLQELIDWLQSAEYDEETAGYGEETAAAEEEKKEEEKAPEESEASRNQREMIDAQKRAQAERAAAAKIAGAAKAKAAADAAEAERERLMTQAVEDMANLEKISDAKNVSQIQVEDNFDIDDI